MTYATLERRIRRLPEEYLEDISSYVDFLLFKDGERKREPGRSQDERGLSVHFGALAGLADGMGMQKVARDEWD